MIKHNDIVLFQGDSITDAGRDYNNAQDLGNGYAHFVAALWAARHPEIEVTFLNRGISGNRVVDLQARWQADCLDLRPTVLSLLIGVNDTWRRYDMNDPTSPDAFAANLRDILHQAKESTDARLVLLEPFLLPVPPADLAWREDLDPKTQAIRALAAEYKATYIPLDGIFAQASCQRPPAFWAADGIHPTAAGHMLIARHWLKAVAR